MMITRLMQPPEGAPGLWATLENGSVYHLLDGDQADMAVALRDWLDTNDLPIEPYVQQVQAISAVVESPVDEANSALASAGFDITVATDEEAADAKAFLEVHNRTELEAAAARFAQNNQISID